MSKRKRKPCRCAPCEAARRAGLVPTHVAEGVVRVEPDPGLPIVGVLPW